MAQVKVITGGQAGIESRTVEIQTVPLQVKVVQGDETRRLQPAVVRNIAMENDSEMDTVTDQCGRTENVREGDKNWEVTIDCIVTDASYRTDRVGDESVNNLTLQESKQLPMYDVVELEGGIFDEISGHFEVDNILINQSNDLVTVNVGAGEHPAYEVQLQLKQASPGDF